jgi:hypothetical protein
LAIWPPPPVLRVLPGNAEAVKGLGADAVPVGLAYGYGLAAAGETGVARALGISDRHAAGHDAAGWGEQG